MAGKPQPRTTIVCGCGKTRDVAVSVVGRVTRCEDCQHEHRKALQRERIDPAANLAKVMRWRQENPERYAASVKAYQERHAPRLREASRRYSAHAKAQAIAAYGGACVCCGTDFAPHLTLDHVQNDGAAERATTTTNMYAVARREGYPDRFQLLCFNCNMAKHFLGGRCPCSDERALHAVG